MKAGTRVRIVSIHKDDAFHNDTALIGQTGTVAGPEEGVLMRHPDKRHYMGAVKLDTPYEDSVGTYDTPYFYKVKLERI